MLNRIGFWFCWALLLLFASAQSRLPLGVFQVAGWTTMYLEYSKTFESKDALQLTLSGQEMCGICEWVNNIRGVVNQVPAFALSLEQIKLLPYSVVAVQCKSPPEFYLSYSHFEELRLYRSDIPQTPPPKIVTI